MKYIVSLIFEVSTREISLNHAECRIVFFLTRAFNEVSSGFEKNSENLSTRILNKAQGE